MISVFAMLGAGKTVQEFVIRYSNGSSLQDLYDQLLDLEERINEYEDDIGDSSASEYIGETFKNKIFPTIPTFDGEHRIFFSPSPILHNAIYSVLTRLDAEDGQEDGKLASDRKEATVPLLAAVEVFETGIKHYIPTTSPFHNAPVRF